MAVPLLLPSKGNANMGETSYTYYPKTKKELHIAISTEINNNIGHIGLTKKLRDSSSILIRDEELYNTINIDLNCIDTSRITDMSYLFAVSKFNGDISRWDVSSVITMAYMFYGSLFNGDISKWDVSKVTNMQGMFTFSQFNNDISKWNTSRVTNKDLIFFRSKFHSNTNLL